MTQLTQEAYALRIVLRGIEELRRDINSLGRPSMERWYRHFNALCDMQQQLRVDWPDEAVQIDAWEAERHQDVEFAERGS